MSVRTLCGVISVACDKGKAITCYIGVTATVLIDLLPIDKNYIEYLGTVLSGTYLKNGNNFNKPLCVYKNYVDT